MNDPEEIRAEIAQARQELGDTVAAVAEKTDVKEQARTKVEDLRGRVETAAQEHPVPLAIIGFLLALLVLRRLRSR
jgi:transposase-like protein